MNMNAQDIIPRLPDEVLDLLTQQAKNGLDVSKEKQLQNWIEANPDAAKDCFDFREKIRKLYWLNLSNEINREKAWDEIASQIQPRQRQRNLFVELLGYAAILAIFAGLSWYLIHSKKDRETITETHSPLPERHNKAILVLSDGKEFTLNSSEKTTLEEKGGITILNKPGEVLTYKQKTLPGKQLIYNKLIVPAGARYQLRLSDGTEAWINSASDLSYPAAFAENERRVRLNGEVFFKVKPDAERPFIIEANGYEIKVLGTSINISAYASDNFIETTLVEGSVEVAGREGRTVKLDPSNLLTIQHEDQQFSVKEVDTRFYTSWKDGVLHFNKITLEELMVKFERWYDVEITFNNRQVKTLLYSGAMENSRNIEFLLDLIKKTAMVDFVITDNKITVE